LGPSEQRANSAGDPNRQGLQMAETADRTDAVEIRDTADSADATDNLETADVVDESSPANPTAPFFGRDELCSALVSSAQANGLPVAFFSNLIWQESRFHPNAVSRAGALGIAQFMPKTAAAVGLDDPLDPLQALPASAQLLARLNRDFGNLGLAAAAYNAGGKRVNDWLAKGIALPKETRDYVLTITGHPVEQWSPSKFTAAESKTLSLARTMPCRGVAEFAAAAANEGASVREDPARGNSEFRQSTGPADTAAPAATSKIAESPRPTEREVAVRRVADMRERWTALRKRWAALSASGHSPAELPMDVGLAQTRKASAKKPIRLAEVSGEAAHKKTDHSAKRRHASS
jgi:Transglycosylase SLT domain